VEHIFIFAKSLPISLSKDDRLDNEAYDKNQPPNQVIHYDLQDDSETLI
jgi:hypothetical protein